jgi:hypothetical protein
MTRNQLLDKLEKLAIKCEKDNIQVAAKSSIYPDLLDMTKKVEREKLSTNKETLEAAEFVSKLLNELNIN